LIFHIRGFILSQQKKIARLGAFGFLGGLASLAALHVLFELFFKELFAAVWTDFMAQLFQLDLLGVKVSIERDIRLSVFGLVTIIAQYANLVCY